ncbi:LamG domain-containing protein [Streptomyces sp. L7]
MTTKGWCYFTIDSTRPKAPTVTNPVGSLYDVCPVDGDGCGVATGGPGKSGAFVFTKNAADANIVAFEYKLATDTKWTKVAGTNSVLRSVKPVLSGLQVLYVRAVDSVGTGQSGDTTAVRINVAESEGASARWNFNDSAVGSGETNASDSATTEGVRHPATLYNTGAGWSGLGRRGSQDRSLVLNDNSDATRQTGYAATAGPVVNTQSSYTVSAWAYLTDDTVYRGVMSQTGSDSSGFVLYYSGGVKRWIFRFNWSDSTGRHFVTTGSTAEGVPLKVWTHVAAVYDADARTIQLYLNGRAQDPPVAVPAGGEVQTPTVPCRSAGPATCTARSRSTGRAVSTRPRSSRRPCSRRTSRRRPSCWMPPAPPPPPNSWPTGIRRARTGTTLTDSLYRIRPFADPVRGCRAGR